MSVLTKHIDTKDGTILLLSVAYLAVSVIAIYAITVVNELTR